MSEIPALVTAHWPPAPSSATDWLLELAGDGVTGFMPPPLPDAAWVLNAMYEQEQGPTDMSYDEHNRARLTDGSIKPQIIASIDLTGVGTATGGIWAAPSTPAPAGGVCAGRSLPGGPAIRSYPTGCYPPTAAFPRPRRRAAGRWASDRPPREAWTARPGTG
ncbi:hypothetical protein AB0D78_11825 [Streptomyces avermitilis]|uniref:hypothetical protein n=1 Tax=Streptomyces avermitilis TaxID=33903 RepID=UPI00340A25F6